MNAKIVFSLLATVCVSLLPVRLVQAAGDPAAGQDKFKACAMCHGTTPPSGEAVPKLGGQHAEYLGFALEQYVSGEREHAGMKSIATALTAQDKQDIAAFLSRFELTKPSIPGSGERTALEKKLENCRPCHGEQGNNFTPHIPRLIGQDEHYLLKALRDYRDGTRKNSRMAYMVKNLTDAELAEMAAYYASQKAGLTPLE